MYVNIISNVIIRILFIRLLVHVFKLWTSHILNHEAVLMLVGSCFASLRQKPVPTRVNHQLRRKQDVLSLDVAYRRVLEEAMWRSLEERTETESRN